MKGHGVYCQCGCPPNVGRYSLGVEMDYYGWLRALVAADLKTAAWVIRDGTTILGGGSTPGAAIQDAVARHGSVGYGQWRTYHEVTP